jgi:hypothetical protein
MNRPRRFRGLRIAWTVAFGLLCLLLIVLWVRSYWWLDFAYYQYSASNCFRAIFHEGQVLFLTEASPGQANDLTRGSIRHQGFDSTAWNVVPFWIFPIIAGLLATAPWIRQWKWRFSLRTLLIVTTLVALALGAAVYFSRQ